ncbi:MAG TPA: type II secretion system F family protein [Bryobacteraceae bacterium]|nr:type II secretion system F family protein [Bryobacteraceae bacterium]
MAEFVLKYADPRGEMHQQVAEAATEKDLRDRYSQQGFLIYSVKPRLAIAGLAVGGGRKKKINLEKFLIFNQQFVTLIRAGLPILKALDLLSERLTDEKLAPHIKAVREEVRNGSLLSDAFGRQGVFPPMYVTSVMAGEKSGSLGEVLDRYITYQRLALAVRKKLLLSLVYPCLLLVLVICLMVFLVTFVVPKFAELYESMSAKLPAATEILIAIGTTARNYILFGFLVLVVAAIAFRFWAKTEKGELRMDRWRMRLPLIGEIWIKYQVAQFARVLGTLLVGGIPLLQALETASSSLGTRLLKNTLGEASQMVKEGQALSASLVQTKIFPALSIDMIEVGESTGALPQMLSSVAEFYEDDVNTRMTASLSLIEPAIMIFMGCFVTFVLVALYLPIFSLADSLR